MKYLSVDFIHNSRVKTNVFFRISKLERQESHYIHSKVVTAFMLHLRAGNEVDITKGCSVGSGFIRLQTSRLVSLARSFND